MQTRGQKTDLLSRLTDVGRQLDAARDPAQMRALITERKRLTAALERLAPPPLRIFRPA